MIKNILLCIVSSLLTYFAIGYYYINCPITNFFEIGYKVSHRTINNEFEYTLHMGKGGGNIEHLEHAFEKFKTENPQHKNLQLYRVTPINYFNLYRWCIYRWEPEWQKYPFLPYWRQ